MRKRKNLKLGAEETVIGTNTTPGESTGQENSTEKGDSRKDYLTVVPAARTDPTVQMQITGRSEVNEQSDHYDKIKEDAENNDGCTTIEESIAHEYTGLRHQTSAPNPLTSPIADQSNNANISGFPALIDSIGFKPDSPKNVKNEEAISSKNTDVGMYVGSDYLG
ncbi:uncharacterized protein LOC134236485 [Saccostrea cucullata]|uniref:uncharacterized protein LOC134236485 n=1 Tax=Saccostrea cuccullata TaxID=36930 RepID=UPI002ED5D974